MTHGKRKWLILLTGLALLGLDSIANASCPSFESPQDVLNCALSEHPSVRQAQARSIQGTSLREVASQRPNPELEANAALGKSQNQGVLNSQFTLSHIFELGGKRSARIEKSEAENEVITAEFLKAKEQVAFDIVTALYRIRQIRTESESLDEALHTFSQIEKQLESRPRLTPDQEVALATFQLVASDYRLRKKALSGDEQALLKYIGLSIGKPFEGKSLLLPKFKEDWPKFSTQTEVSTFRGSDMNRLRAKFQTSEADLSLAKSASWPNLKLGPTFEAETQVGIFYQAFGLALSLPLPLYQANGGGRAYASAGLSLAEVTLETAGNQLQTERQQELLKYQASLEAMEEVGTLRVIEKRHQNIERLFRGGLIQSTLVIEAHRQIVDLTRNVNEQELIAIRSLWRIYAIEGRVLQEKI
jgi:cobalt-zinc-cadmium efflux system outer membrane protein